MDASGFLSIKITNLQPRLVPIALNFMIQRRFKIISKISDTDWQSHWSPKHDNENSIILDHLIYEGLLDAAVIFATEKKLPINVNSFHKKRHRIRLCIEEGNIDQAINDLNDLDASFLDSYTTVYYHLLAQKVNEMINKKEDQFVIVKYMQNEIGPLVEDNENLQQCLEDLMVYLVFGEGDIQAMRNDVASYVNTKIMEMHEMADPLRDLVSDIVKGEFALSEQYQHPLFDSYCD